MGAKARAVWGHGASGGSINLSPIQPMAGQSSPANVYRQYALWSDLTVNPEQRLITWNRQGIMATHDGPCVVKLWRSYYLFATRYVATESQFIVLVHKDGKREHIKGPTVAFFNPSLHQFLTVSDMYQLNTNEIIVAYNRQEDGAVKRKLVAGPALHMPEPNQWVHSFSWGTADSACQVKPQAPQQQPQQAQLAQLQAVPTQAGQQHKFYRLVTTPDTMEIVVENVRTADDGLLDVNLMLTFQIVDAERLLDNTQDPITDITNSVAADIIALIARTEFESFKESTEALNSLQTYQQAVEKAKIIGCALHKIVFKGYNAGDALQAMQDKRISSRTQLAAEEETERLKQRMLDFQLQKERERGEQKQLLDVSAMETKLKLLQMEEAHRQKDRVEKMNQELSFVKSLKEILDTKSAAAYLIARNSPVPDKIVKHEPAVGHSFGLE